VESQPQKPKLTLIPGNPGVRRDNHSPAPNDLELGVKFALTEQQRCFPESALILQMTVPSGSRDFSADRVLTGIHYDCSWDIIKGKLSVETVIAADGAVDDHGHTFTLFSDGVTAAYNLTKRLEAFGELDAFFCCRRFSIAAGLFRCRASLLHHE
jgi:hypothetical protein